MTGYNMFMYDEEVDEDVMYPGYSELENLFNSEVEWMVELGFEFDEASNERTNYTAEDLDGPHQ